jgi:hypothetical protein
MHLHLRGFLRYFNGMKQRVLLAFLPLIIVLLAGAAAPLAAQINIGIGMQAGYTAMPNANLPVDRYNDRGFLYRQMRKFHWPMGEIYLASLRHNRLLLELSMNSRRNRIAAESFDGAVLNHRDVRFNMQVFGLGAGYAVQEKDDFVLYLAGSVDLGFAKMETRTGPKASIGRTPYYLFQREGLLALSGYLKMVFRNNSESITSYSITPYFQYPLTKFDFFYLNQLLNPATALLDGTTLPARPWNVGLQVNFDLDLLRFLE